MEFEISQLAGPLGGALALAFAAGTSMGYKFSQRTSVKFVREKVADLEKYIQKKEDEYILALNHQDEEHKKITESQNSIIHKMQIRIKELEDSRLTIALGTLPNSENK